MCLIHEKVEIILVNLTFTSIVMLLKLVQCLLVTLKSLVGSANTVVTSCVRVTEGEVRRGENNESFSCKKKKKKKTHKNMGEGL